MQEVTRTVKGLQVTYKANRININRASEEVPSVGIHYFGEAVYPDGSTELMAGEHGNFVGENLSFVDSNGLTFAQVKNYVTEFFVSEMDSYLKEKEAEEEQPIPGGEGNL